MNRPTILIAPVTYSYLDNSSLVGQIAFRRSGTTRMTTTKQYGYLNRLTAISSVPSGASTVSNIYNLKSANQRTRSTLADGWYWAYGFWKELSHNASTALWSNIVVAATGQPSVTVCVFIAKTPEVFQYDADGNLTNDGRWGYSWDAENRLISMRGNTALGLQQLIQFEYDSKGRRIHKRVWPNTTGTGNPTNDVKFVYDGWNLVGELSSANAVIRSYSWGLDLSSSSQGAGGVGGLLAVNAAASGVHFVAFDGNGRVSALVQATDGALSGQYEYGPFGELLRATGPMAKANPFRFSTKYQDDEVRRGKVQNSSGRARKPTRQLTLQPVAAEASMEAMKCSKPLVQEGPKAGQRASRL